MQSCFRIYFGKLLTNQLNYNFCEDSQHLVLAKLADWTVKVTIFRVFLSFITYEINSNTLCSNFYHLE